MSRTRGRLTPQKLALAVRCPCTLVDTGQNSRGTLEFNGWCSEKGASEEPQFKTKEFFAFYDDNVETISNYDKGKVASLS